MKKEYSPRVKKGLIKGLPSWFKAFFIKFWFAGAVFYFVGWGLFFQSADQLDLTVALGLVLGIVTEFAVNNILVYLESDKKEFRPFLLYYSPKFYSIFINVPVCIVISLLISYTYHFINLTVINIGNYPQGHIALGAEPIVYGLFFALYDCLFLGIKRVIFRILHGFKEGM